MTQYRRMRLPTLCALFALLGSGAAQDVPDRLSPDPDMPRPIAALDSVFIEELTRLEMNGPYLAAGKHQYILRANTEAGARKLGKKWAGGKTAIHYIPEFYKSAQAREFLESEGIRQTNEGRHDSVASSTQAMVTDPAAARTEQRIAAGKMSINGVDIAPPGGIAGGRKIVERRASLTAAKIREALRRNRSADSF